MSDFVSLVLPAGADTVALARLMAAHGRNLRPQDNASLQAHIGSDWRAYLTHTRESDEGTALGAGSRPSGPRLDAERDAARMRKRGWNEARIARALAQRSAHAQWAGQQAPQRAHLRAAHTADAEAWSALLQALFAEGVERLGLMVRSYERSVGARLTVDAEQDLTLDAVDPQSLIDLRPGVLYWITR